MQYNVLSTGDFKHSSLCWGFSNIIYIYIYSHKY